MICDRLKRENLARQWKRIDVGWSRAGVGRERLTNIFIAVCPKIEVAAEGRSMEEAAKALDKAVGKYLRNGPMPVDPRKQILDALIELKHEVSLVSANSPSQFRRLAFEQKRIQARIRKYTIILLRKELMQRLGKKVSDYTQWNMDITNEWVERIVTRSVVAGYIAKNGTAELIPEETMKMADSISEFLQERFKPCNAGGYRDRST